MHYLVKNERRSNLELFDLLETRFNVFLPRRDGALIDSLKEESLMSVEEACRVVFDLDIAAIKDSDIFFLSWMVARTMREFASNWDMRKR